MKVVKQRNAASADATDACRKTTTKWSRYTACSVRACQLHGRTAGVSLPSAARKRRVTRAELRARVGAAAGCNAGFAAAPTRDDLAPGSTRSSPLTFRLP